MNNVKLAPYKRSSSMKSVVDTMDTRISTNIGGLGRRYYDQLSQDLDKIIQVDVTNGVTETKGSVRGRAIQLALEMRSRGVSENDVIVIVSRTHADQTVVVLASLFLGAIVAPLNPEFSYKESLELVKKLKPKMCFCDIRMVSQMERIMPMLSHAAELIHFGEKSGSCVPFSKLFAHKESEYFQPVFIENPVITVAFILPTQGTTGNPKLICLSHQNVFGQTALLLHIFNYPDKIISFFPLCWIIQTALTCASFEANVMRILPGAFTERSACKIIHDFEVGYAIFGTDYAMKLISNVAIKARILSLPDFIESNNFGAKFDFNLNCLKCIMIGTVNTTKYDIQQLKTLMPHVKYLQCYCLTETGLIAASTIRNYAESLEKPDSVGQILCNGKIKIMDLDSRENAGPDRFGELYFKGDGMMLGYFKETDKTLAAMEKGYFKTGDVAMYDEEGWLYVQGRLEDVITRDDRRIYAIELENIILMHPLVKDVAVVGDSKQVVACVVRKRDTSLSVEKLTKFISERVPSYHMPTKIVFLDGFPRTTIGSVKRKILREELLTIKIEYSSSFTSINVD
ncbi:hypothetical protein NQ315_006516 [Exocentrus adspersus]|uniref:Uncharacterized protein n=1 Tax=Exocentrus adspersus TaxID=1586481 RepID=A0AAV8W1N7_9CUCU|nr:hypothetical protein NQ315_006516 [Exocentrus adspersus]